MPYVFHPFHLAEQMRDEKTTIVALLHDVIEDTDYTFEDLRSAGFDNEIIEALKLMTLNESVPYMEYVTAIKFNPIATAVKLADLEHNSDLSRLDIIDEKTLKRKVCYSNRITYKIKKSLFMRPYLRVCFL